MKKLILLIILVIPYLICAQTDSSADTDKTEFNLNGTAGYVTVGSQTYSQLRFLPELKIRKFSFGLDLDLLMDSDMNIRRADWDEPEDLLYKIYYIKYSEQNTPFYMRAGGFPDYTLGHGLIMNKYSNLLLYPTQRSLGAMIGCNLNMEMQPGLELFSANLAKNEILAANAHFKPFHSSEDYTLSNLIIGATFATDRNQYGKYKDKDKDGVPDVLDPNPKLKNYRYDLDGDGLYNSETPNAYGMYTTEDPDMDGDGILDSPLINSYVNANIELYDPALVYLLDNDIQLLRRYGKAKELRIMGLNYSLPLVENDSFILENYAEYAKIDGYGSGFILPGFFAKFLFMNFNLEGRKFGDKFIPGYFDQLYDEQRSGVVGDTVLVTKTQSLTTASAAIGWYGSISADLVKSIIVSASYQDMYGQGNTLGKSIMGKIGLYPKMILKLEEASISYSQSNVRSFSLNKIQTPSTAINGILAYRLSDKSVLVGKYSERYVDLNGDNQIKGLDEIIKSLSLLVEFQL